MADAVAPSSPRRLYLDNAATSFPKPRCVHDAMLRYATSVGASPGRGSYAESIEGARLIAECRRRLCTLINGQSPDHIVFTLNTTDALNLAIKGMVQHRRRTHPGRPIHLITTAMDHNSVLRPLNALRADGVDWTCLPVHPASGLLDPDDLRRAVTRDTLLVAVVHASNVTGTLQPIAHIGRACRDAGVPLLVDAAQSIGHVPIDVQAMAIDLLAFPGHKGLLGPLGTGGLYLRPGLEKLITPLREGGTGSRSELDTQPDTMPDKYEPGSHNTPGIVGLSEALRWLLDRSIDAIASHERDLTAIVLASLAQRDAYPGLRLIGPRTLDHRVGVFSLVHDLLSPAELAMALESGFGILVRAGLHCAPRAHRAMGTLDAPQGDRAQPHAGAVRLSLGPFVTPQEVSYAMNALSSVCLEAAATA